MKKLYIKPEIMFESFSLSTNIAGDCEEKTNNPTNGTCGMDFSGFKVFMHDMNGCSDIKVNDGESFNGLCYDTPTADNNLFNS